MLQKGRLWPVENNGNHGSVPGQKVLRKTPCGRIQVAKYSSKSLVGVTKTEPAKTPTDGSKSTEPWNRLTPYSLVTKVRFFLEGWQQSGVADSAVHSGFFHRRLEGGRGRPLEKFLAIPSSG